MVRMARPTNMGGGALDGCVMDGDAMDGGATGDGSVDGSVVDGDVMDGGSVDGLSGGSLEGAWEVSLDKVYGLGLRMETVDGGTDVDQSPQCLGEPNPQQIHLK